MAFTGILGTWLTKINGCINALSVSGTTVTYTKTDGSSGTITTQDTTYSTMTGATSSVAGAAGLVPAPAAGDDGKFLTGGGVYTTAIVNASISGSTLTLTKLDGTTITLTLPVYDNGDLISY